MMRWTTSRVPHRGQSGSPAAEGVGSAIDCDMRIIFEPKKR